MQITVEYAAQIKRAAGQAGETFECDSPCTVEDLLHCVADRHGEPLSNLLFDSNRRLHPSILLFVGDSQIRWDEPRQLQDRDVLTILSPISGG
jgi:molybdopterin converting factor small subunit